MRNDIMIDIETLGTNDGASIFQIAAVNFDITSGEIKSKINLIGDIEHYSKLSVDGKTLKWWLETDAELLHDLLSRGTLTEVELLTSFYAWLRDQSENGDMRDVYLWGNGILFDNAKIKRAFEDKGIYYPINYANDRDVRTILDLASLKTGLTREQIREITAEGSDILHDAYSDCLRQIRFVHNCYSLLTDWEAE